MAVGQFLLMRATHQKFEGVLRPGFALANEAIGIAGMLFALWVMSRLEQKPLSAYGYRGESRGVRFISGICWGFVAVSALVLTLWKLGYLALSGSELGGASAVKFAVEWAGIFLLVGFFEESLLRGYAQLTLTRGIGFWWGALLLSIAFGGSHGSNPGESPVGLVSAGLVGLVFCLSLWYTGSLWWAIGFHAAWDWGQSYFYGTADSGLLSEGHLLNQHPAGSLWMSGGKTGPEGSLLVLPLLAIIAAVMMMWWGPRTKSPFAGAGWRPKRKPAPQPSGEAAR